MGLFDGKGISLFGGENSFLRNPDQMWGGENSFFNKPLGSKPEAPAPPPPPPDPSIARTNALENQLNQELNIRRSSSIATSGMGLLEEPQIQSAGQLLLGS